MKTEDLFTEVPKEQRAEMLTNIAIKTEYQEVKRPYSDDEKTQMKDFVTEESISVMDNSDEMKKIVKEFQATIKEAKSGLIDALKSIKRGYSSNEELVFLVDDQEGGNMNTYDANGIHIGSRKLYPDERQTRIVEMKTGTND